MIAIALVVFSYMQIKKSSELSEQKNALSDRVKEMEERYQPIIDMDNAVAEAKAEREEVKNEISNLREDYSSKKIIYDKLKNEMAIYDESLKLAEFGVYEPSFDYDSSEKFKQAIQDVRQKQKTMISDKTAIVCHTDWNVSGSIVEGRKMTNRNIRLTARAFNGECDTAIASVTWKNISRMEARINKAFEMINKLNESNHIQIKRAYLRLKLEELRLTYERKEKIQNEKDEQRAIREQMAEEAKLDKELKSAQKEEEKLAKLVSKARRDAENAVGEEMESMSVRLKELEAQLEEAHSKSERAISMAQQTKAGHVYIISNIGSFGESVYKIGMTRRLEPLDRVKELGDASVPFEFDVHAMIHSSDAPALENSLHKAFDQQRLNIVNSRKEFFRVTLDEIRDEVTKHAPDADFYVTAEARQYRETCSILEQLQADEAKLEEALPEAI